MASRDLPSFSKRIGRRADQVAAGVNAVKIQAAGAVLRDLVTATPVDTGRARGNWQVGLGSPVRDARGVVALGAAISQGLGKAARAKEGQDIYVSNNVEYIQALNDGWSAQAPAGFVEATITRVLALIRSARIITR